MTTDERERQRERHRDAMRRLGIVRDALRVVESDYATMGDVALTSFTNDLRK